MEPQRTTIVHDIRRLKEQALNWHLYTSMVLMKREYVNKCCFLSETWNVPSRNIFSVPNPVLWLTQSSVNFSVYIHCSFREFLSHFLFYFQNSWQAATNFSFTVQHSKPRAKFICSRTWRRDPNHRTLIAIRLRVPRHVIDITKHRYNQISGHYSAC
jgi:hypothetical protein